jgi:hypothetical protein
VRELELTDRWLAMWARKVNPSTLPPVDPGVLLAVDLEGAGGFAVIPAAPATVSASLRFAATAKISQSVRGRVKRLLEGESPASLKLGEDCVVESCVPLLKHLFARWCLVPKRLYADAVETGVELCGGGMEAMHFRLTGRTLTRPDTRDRLTFAEVQRMTVRDAVADYDAGRDDAERRWAWERWQGVVAVTDAMLARSQAAAHRWQLGQIVACREADEIRFAHVSWIAEDYPESEDPPEMSIGLAFWPGRIESALMRSTDELLKKEPPFPAFYLRGDGGAAGTLVVPPRMFAPGRRLHPAHGAGGAGVRLTRLVQRGADFERVAFEVA